MTENKAYDVVYQGVAGSYTEMALVDFNRHHGLNLNPIEERGFFEGVYDKMSNETGLAFVPFVNSQAGTVYQNIDLFMQHDIEILAEYYFDVDHVLAVREKFKDEPYEKVYSHYQALDQSSQFIRARGLIPVTFHDTAAAAEMVSNSDTPKSCVCSERAAMLYGLHIVERKIQNIKNNTTRFLLVRRKGDRFPWEHQLREGDTRKTSVIFELDSQPGTLVRAIDAFGQNSINITKLESRPSRKQNFTYRFYMEFDGGAGEDAVDEAISELESNTVYCNVLGSYSKIDIKR